MYFQNSFPHFFSSFPSLKISFFSFNLIIAGTQGLEKKCVRGFLAHSSYFCQAQFDEFFFWRLSFFQTSVLTSSCMPSSGDSRLVSGNAVSPTLAATPLLRCTKLFTFLFTLAQRPLPPPGDMDDPVGVGVDPVGEHRPGGTPCSW